MTPKFISNARLAIPRGHKILSEQDFVRSLDKSQVCFLSVFQRLELHVGVRKLLYWTDMRMVRKLSLYLWDKKQS